MFDPDQLARPSVLQLKPYSSARDDFKGAADIWLDANENPYGDGLNRYPDPHHLALKAHIAKLKGIKIDQILLGNGSDEVIDLLIRAFVEPHQERVLICPPTYGMYAVTADINAVGKVEVPLLPDSFQLNLPEVLPHLEDPNLKLLFLCSPNNPTGNLLHRDDLLHLASTFRGLIVVDEAYQDFAQAPSLLTELTHYPNLVVMQTFSKAWGLAAIRLGMLFAHPGVVALLRKIKPPYNVNKLTQDCALAALQDTDATHQRIHQILKDREQLRQGLMQTRSVQQVYPSDANFLLVRMAQPKQAYQYLADRGIIVRDRSKAIPGCLRITVGTKAENQTLLATLADFAAKWLVKYP